jgi:acyl carrier protein
MLNQAAPARPDEERSLADILAGIITMLRQVTGEDARWAGDITPASRIEADLRIDSLELAALGDLLQETYGDVVDLPGYLAGLDIGQIVALSVGDLAAYVAAAPPPAEGAAAGANR